MIQTSEITARSWMMVVLLGFTWGGTFIVTEIALEGITPFWLAAGRIAFASILMYAIWQARGGALFAEPPTQKPSWSCGLWGSKLCNSLHVIGMGSAIRHGRLCWCFDGCNRVNGPPISTFFVPGERLTWRKSLGFSIGFCGVVILMGAKAFESTGASLETAGRLACLIAAMCYGVNSIMMRRLPAIDTIGLSTVLLIMSAAIVIPIALIVEGFPPMPSTKTMIVIALLGLIPTAAANFLRTLVIRSAGPVFMSITNYQVPVWSVVLGALLLGEPLPTSLIMAMVLILAGVGLSQYGAFRKLFRR